MGTLMVVLEDDTGSSRVVTATGENFHDDMRLLNVLRVKAELGGWHVMKIKRNGRVLRMQEDE